MLHEQHIFPPQHLTEVQPYKFSTGDFLFSSSTVVPVISPIVKLHSLMMTLILPKLTFNFLVVDFSDKVNCDYTENLLLSSHTLFGVPSFFIPPWHFLCYDYPKKNSYKRNSEKVTGKLRGEIYFVKHALF